MEIMVRRWSARTLLSGLLLAIIFGLLSLPASAQEDGATIRRGVREAARADGRVRVVINLRLPDGMERALQQPNANVPLDRLESAVATAQAAVLDALAPGRIPSAEFQSANFELIHQYEFVPALAGFLTPEGINILANHPMVASIQIDEEGTGGLAEARTIIDANHVPPSFGINGEGQRVAVVDSGVDLAHPYLQDDINNFGVCYTFQDCEPGNVSQSGNADDENGHGTAVAGIVTSSSPTHPGIAPGVVIVPVRVLDRNNTGFLSDWISGLNWIITNQGGLGVDVVVIAIQTQATFGSPCDAIYPSLANPVNTLVNAMNIPVVSITGNYGLANVITSPGCLSNAVAVGATYDYNGVFAETGCADTAVIDKVACFSNGGVLVDLVAPGAIIHAPNMFTNADSPWSGTSAAAPMVAATMAMMRQIDNNLSQAQMVGILQQTGRPVVDPRNGLTYRRINASAALDFLDPIAALTPGPASTVVRNNPLFTWENRTYSSHFQVQVWNIVTNQIQTSDWLARANASCSGSTCSGRFAFQLVDGVSRWRVRTNFQGQQAGRWSDWREFTAIGPVLGAPNGTVNTGLPTYNWVHLSGALWYRLLVRDSQGIEFDQWYPASSLTCGDGTCNVQPQLLDAVLLNGGYRWFVRPWFGDSYGIWGGPQTFTVSVGPPAAPSNPVVTGTNTRQPTFSWTLASGVDAGGVWLNVRVTRADTGQVVLNNWYSRNDACATLTGITCQVTASQELAENVPYLVTIRAFGPGGMGPFSGAAPFSLNVPEPIVSGLNFNVARGDPQFFWNYDNRALWYQLVIAREDGSLVLNQWYEVNDSLLTCSGGTCSVIPGIFLTNGTYIWKVRPWGKGGFGAEVFGPSITLSLGPPPAPNVANLHTANMEVHEERSRLIYIWPDVAGASWYHVQILNPAQAVLHNQWYRRRNVCEGLTCDVTPQLYLPNANGYLWRVRAWGPGGMGQFSNLATFDIAAQSQAAPPNIAGATPAGLITTNYPIFTWQTRSGVIWVRLVVRDTQTNQFVYAKWFPVDQLGCAGGSGTCTADQSDLGGLELRDGSYAFMIRFWGPSGLSPYSAEQFFTVNGPIAGTVNAPITPVDDSTITNPAVTFSWNATSNTTWYGLKVTDTATNTTTTIWRTAQELGCAGGGICSLTVNLTPSIYRWTVSTWGPGTVGATIPVSPAFDFTLLQ